MKIIIERIIDYNWQLWNVGDKVRYFGTEFDGSFEFFGVITKKFDDHLIAESEGMTLWIDDFSADMFERIN